MWRYSAYLLVILLSWDSLVKPAEPADSLTDEIMNLPNADITFLQNGRQLIMNSLENQDLAKVQAVAKRLEMRFRGTDVLPFWLGERVWLHLITGRYQFLLQTSRMDSIIQRDVTGLLTPPRDNLFNRLQQFGLRHERQVWKAIRQSSYAKREQEYLGLLTTFMLFKNESSHLTQDDLNKACDQFLFRYPESPYEDFIRSQMRRKYEMSPWGFGFEFFSGYGQFRGDLATYFSNNVPIGVAFDIYYYRIGLFLRDYIGVGGTVQQAFEYNGYWDTKLPLNVYLPELTVGYAVVDRHPFRITPFAGFSSMDIGPPEKQRSEGHDVYLKFVTTYTYGVNLDIFVKPSQLPIVARQEKSGWLLTLRAALNRPTYTKRDSRFGGTMIYFTIGFGGFGHKLHREY